MLKPLACIFKPFFSSWRTAEEHEAIYAAYLEQNTQEQKLLSPEPEIKTRRMHHWKKVSKEISDPMAKLGFGCAMYRDILWALVCSFTLFSVLVVPSLLIFSDGTAYANEQESQA